MALRMKTSPAKFLIPLAFASSLGGILTLIGTPPNLIVSNTLAENGFEPMSFFGYTPIGLIILTAGIFFMVVFGKKLLPEAKAGENHGTEDFTPEQLAGFYKTYEYLHLIKVPEHSYMIGKRIIDLQLPELYGITVVSLKRKEDGEPVLNDGKKIVLNTKTVFKEDDIVLLFGEKSEVDKLCDKYRVTRLSSQRNAQTSEQFLTRTYGMTEIIITPQSSFHKKTIQNCNLEKNM